MKLVIVNHILAHVKPISQLWFIIKTDHPTLSLDSRSSIIKRSTQSHRMLERIIAVLAGTAPFMPLSLCYFAYRAACQAPSQTSLPKAELAAKQLILTSNAG